MKTEKLAETALEKGISTLVVLANLDNIKPILHPLSDLTKYCEDLGFVPIVQLSGLSSLKGTITYGYEHKIYWAKLQIPKTNEFVCKTFPCDILSMDYWVIQKLYEWHFDIHGLIETGLAIDINTLKQ